MRESGVCKAWAWDSVDERWEWNGGTTGWTFLTGHTEDMRPEIFFEQENNGAVYCNVTSFEIVEGCEDMITTTTTTTSSTASTTSTISTTSTTVTE